MKLLRLLIVIVVVAVVASYMGWLHFSSGGQDNKPNYGVTVDKDKIRAEKDKAVEKVENLGHTAYCAEVARSFPDPCAAPGSSLRAHPPQHTESVS